jgi:glycylpeptide N-tetradecanoyltransferase
VTQILNDYLKRYKLYQIFDEAEVRHFLRHAENLVYVYVVDGPEGITDVVSFYCLPSSILNHPEHNDLKAAYMCAFTLI